MSDAATAVVEICIFQALKDVARHAICAKQKLGIDVTQEKHRLESMRYAGPTLVARVELVGWSQIPMYDEHPDLASFTVRTSRNHDIKLQSLQSAKKLLDARRLMDIWHSGFIGDRDGCTADFDAAIHDLETNVDGVRLLDNLGSVVAEATVTMWARAADGEGWVFSPSVTWKGVDFSVLEQRDALLVKADSLDAEASFEAGWDNFDTAKGLRADADSIRRKIQIAENVTRLVL